jgi:hypothetical protein
MLRLGERSKAEVLARTLRHLAFRNGGAVPYAFPAAEDFPDLPAAAPTLWLAFLEAELAGAKPTIFPPE